MKTQNRIRAAGLLLLSLVFQFSFASIGGSVMGQVVDPNTKEPVSLATVVFDNQGTQKVFTTNEHGYYYASNLPAGLYDITVSYSSNHTNIPGFKIGNDEEQVLDISLTVGLNMETVVISAKKKPRPPVEPIINPLDPQADILKHKDMMKMGFIGTGGIAEVKSCVVKQNGEYYVRGSRAGGLSYYIDDCRVMGNADIPLCGLDTYRMYNGFIPPKYGDATGGVVVIETRNYFSEH